VGGHGSGRRWHIGAKDTTDDYRKLDVRRLQRDGLLSPGQHYSCEWSRNGEKLASIQIRTELNKVILSYRHRSGGDEWQDKEYPVWLDWTGCNYGGQRAWFRCPSAGCGCRVAILYCGSIFACRHCHQLAYSSQREDSASRMIRKADKIRAHLGWVPGIANAPGQKPKGMRLQTYWRLCKEQADLADVGLATIIQKLGLKLGD